MLNTTIPCNEHLTILTIYSKNLTSTTQVSFRHMPSQPYFISSHSDGYLDGVSFHQVLRCLKNVVPDNLAWPHQGLPSVTRSIFSLRQPSHSTIKTWSLSTGGTVIAIVVSIVIVCILATFIICKPFHAYDTYYPPISPSTFERQDFDRSQYAVPTLNIYSTAYYGYQKVRVLLCFYNTHSYVFLYLHSSVQHYMMSLTCTLLITCCIF